MHMFNRGAAGAVALLVVLSTSLFGVAQASAAAGLLAEWGSVGSGDGQFNGPAGVAVDAAGTVYVADHNNHRVQKFTPDGGFLGKWQLQSANGRSLSPNDIAVGPAGNVYVASAGPYENGFFPDSGMQRFTPDGVLLAEWTLVTPDGLEEFPAGIPDSIEVDRAGTVYVGNGSEIQKFNSNGAFLGKWGSYGAGPGQFRIPATIASDASGAIYIGDGANYRVEKFTPDGAFLGMWGSKGSGDGQFGAWTSSSLYSVTGLAVDPSGAVYASDEYNHRVQKFTSNGEFLGKWGSKGSGDGQFRFPGKLALDSAGNLYVADGLNFRIQKFDPEAAIAAGSESDLATVSGPVRFRNGRVLLKIQCPGPDDCAGKVQLVTTTSSRKRPGHGSATLSRKRRHSHRRKSRRKIVIGKAGYKIPAGKRKTVRIGVNRRGRRLLRGHRKRGLRVQVRGASLKNRSIRLKLGRKSKGGRR